MWRTVLLQSLIEEKDGKFVEYHHDKADPTLSASMVREIVGDELVVVSGL